MKIVYKKSFLNRLREHIDFIASDNVKAAEQLKNQLLRKLQQSRIILIYSGNLFTLTTR